MRIDDIATSLDATAAGATTPGAAACGSPAADSTAPEDAAALRHADEQARGRALDPGGSFIVQAPAGSGKTELLTHRFLELLARVDEPEQILAITFTRAATAEMRGRVLGALERARDGGAQDRLRDRLAAAARAALDADARRGWRLLEQPQRLNIQTIDSLSFAIAQQTPLLSRLGGSLQPVDDAGALYAAAARRTLARLGGADADLNAAIGALLELRQTSLAECEGLIAGMLAQRDQWGRAMPLGRQQDWERVRESLESPFREELRRALERANTLFATNAAITGELRHLLSYACENLRRCDPASRILALEACFPDSMSEWSHWTALCEFLLKKQGELRASGNAKLGFPAAGKGGGSAERRAHKERFEKLLRELAAHPGFCQALCRLREAPPPAYSPEQWRMIRHTLVILRHAVAELRVIFAEKGQVDFVELGLAASEVLRNQTDRLPADLAALWPHLLVDEFQDTSRAQYDLFSLLVEAREQPGTCFFVGDPMQSIYGFRQAEVELFESTRKHGLGEAPPRFALSPLTLRMNFRSHAGLVEPLNRIFREVFGGAAARDHYRVAFTESAANDAEAAGESMNGATVYGASVHVAAQYLHSRASQEEKRAAREAEAARAVEIIQRHWPQAEAAAKARGKFRIAVLARAKRHLWSIAAKLREAGIPYRAVEIERLGERQEVLDAAAVVRALTHPMDRIAWLSVLRAPWCGLTLDDLHMLCGRDDRELAARPMLELLRMRTGLLSEDGRERASRTLEVMEAAIRGQSRQPSFAQWAERAWLTLGGEECVGKAEATNVRAFFCALEEAGPGELEQRLAALFAAPNPETSESSGVQLMTIHKAKGLEFEVVLAPGLDQPTAGDDSPLLTWLERTSLEGPEEEERREFLAAPLGRKGEDSDPLYRWIQRQKREREREEAKRLLYVACTRAIEELYLLATVTVSDDEDGAGPLRRENGGSLLSAAWPGLRSYFLADYEKRLQEGAISAPAAGGPEADAALKSSGKGESAPAAKKNESEKNGGSSSAPGPAPGKLWRLPPEWRYPEWRYPEDAASPLAATDEPAAATEAPAAVPALQRPAGSLAARAVGAVTHALLDEIARIFAAGPEAPEPEAPETARWRPRAVAMLRQAGLAPGEAQRRSATVILALKNALEDPAGRWILRARNRAESETSWSAWSGETGVETLATRRPDRIFLAGATQESEGESHLWIVDYKTAEHSGEGLEAFLEAEKRQYKPQLALYGKMLRDAGWAPLPLRLALYYPLVMKLIWWDE